jgi:hypothetical protein
MFRTGAFQLSGRYFFAGCQVVMLTDDSMEAQLEIVYLDLLQGAHGHRNAFM